MELYTNDPVSYLTVCQTFLIGLCRITEYSNIRLMFRSSGWFFPVLIFEEKRNAASTENKVFVEVVFFVLGIPPPPPPPIMLSSTFGRHLASLSYSQCYLRDVGQAMSGLILLMYQVSSQVNRPSNIEYLIKITIRISGYQIIRKRRALLFNSYYLSSCIKTGLNFLKGL